MNAESTNVTSMPFEAITPRSWWRGLFSARFVDIWLMTGAGGLVALILLVLAILAGPNEGGDWSEQRQILVGALLAVIGGTVARFYELANKRAGTIDMITSDIISITRLFVAVQVLDDFMADARHCRDAMRNAGTTPKGPAIDARGDPRPGNGAPTPRGQGFADKARSSDYFAVFHAVIPDLRALDAGPVNDVTAFYTFFKGGRDATESAERWKNADYPPQSRINDIVAIIYAMNLSLLHGRRAIRILVQDPTLRKAADKIFEDLIIEGLSFLDEFLPVNGDDRRKYNRARIDAMCAEDKKLKARFQRDRSSETKDAVGGAVTTPGTP